jgi:phospholipid/cholesterol/gamma-HCH transport system permease protein
LNEPEGNEVESPSPWKSTVRSFYRLGEWMGDGLEGAGHAVSLFGETVLWLRAVWAKREDIRDKIVVTGFGSLPVVLLVAFFTGLILALQSGIEARRFNQEAAVGALVAATMFREMGPVMTSIILAALVGSSYAAELGTMAVSEEIDALRVMSISPVKYLVMPRVVALAVTAPILTLISDVVGILGGAVIAGAQLRVDMEVYYSWVQWASNLTDVFNGLFKSFVFGVIIAILGCSQGIRATRGAEGVGQATMKAVVISFVLILITDYLINWFLYPMF